MEENNKEESKTDVIEVETATTGEEKEKQQEITNAGKGFSIASMVLGIVSIVILGNFWISIACGVLAIIFGLKGKEREGKGMAKAGFILGIISLSIRAVCLLAVFVLGMTFMAFI